MIGGHGSLQNLLTGAHNNPQILEQLLSSGALSSLQPGLFEGIRCAPVMTMHTILTGPDWPKNEDIYLLGQ